MSCGIVLGVRLGRGVGLRCGWRRRARVARRREGQDYGLAARPDRPQPERRHLAAWRVPIRRRFAWRQKNLVARRLLYQPPSVGLQSSGQHRLHAPVVAVCWATSVAEIRRWSGDWCKFCAGEGVRSAALLNNSVRLPWLSAALSATLERYYPCDRCKDFKN